MSIRTKCILSYVGGFVSGAVVLIVVCLCINSIINGQSPWGRKLDLFDEPGQEIIADRFEVIQVLPNGNALALRKNSVYDFSGMAVLFLAEEDLSYYDDQVINVPDKKRVLQIGTYRYETHAGIEKTVPVVRIMD